MLISKCAKVELSNNVKYYENLGYLIPKYKNKNNKMVVLKHTKIIVRIEDLPLKSHTLVEVKCDYCNNPYTISYKEYNTRNKNIVDKDCCSNCAGIKRIESNLITYGVRATSQLPEVINQIKLKYEDIKIAFESRNYALISKEYIHNTESLKFICNKHKDKGIQEIIWTQFNRGFGCNYCSYELISKRMKGENNSNWKGGITPLHIYLRDKIKDWRLDSLKYYNYKCEITNISNGRLDVHHIYGFNIILKETLDELNVELKDNFTEYKEEELELIANLIIKKHYDYGLGIPLIHELHILYHSAYGKNNSNIDDFEKFKEELFNGKYNNYLIENNIILPNIKL